MTWSHSLDNNLKYIRYDMYTYIIYKCFILNETLIETLIVYSTVCIICPHFTDEETEAQRASVAGPRSYSRQLVKLGVDPTLSPKSPSLNHSTTAVSTGHSNLQKPTIKPPFICSTLQSSLRTFMPGVPSEPFNYRV